MWLSVGRRAPAIWRQGGDEYIPATLAPRDNHRQLAGRGRRAYAADGFADATSAIDVGLAVETDTALACAAVQILPTGMSVETDTALALDAGSASGAGIASETDTALALAGVQIKTAGLAAEVDTALALTGVTGTAPGIATESDTAFALVAVQKMLVGIASEVDTAFALSPAAAPGDDLALILKILRNRQELNPSTGKFTLYDDDGTTVLAQSNAWADVGGTQPYSGGTLARIDALI